MKAIQIVILKIILILNFNIAFANENLAQTEETLKPVMLIRYSKPEIYYEKALEMLAKKALATKSESNFTIETVKSSITKPNKVDLNSEVQNIVNILVEHDVKIEKIFINEKADHNLAQDEIHIFVE